MNTLLLTPELFTSDGGITRILRLYLKALNELAKEPDTLQVVSLNDRTVDREMLARYCGARVSKTCVCSGSRIKFILRALQMGLRSKRIVCGHVGQLPVAWAVSLLRPGLHYYLVAHGIEVWRSFTWLERLALRGARQVWCVSKFTQTQLLSNCALQANRTAVLPNALDPFLEGVGAEDVPTDSMVILSISRLSIADSYKGIQHLIAAMPHVRSKIGTARLRIVGRGDALPGLRQLAVDQGVFDCVEFPGFVSDADLHAEFGRCRIFALPSEKEGFGLVYLEAMAHGRPCLGALSGGTPEVITSESGTLVGYGNVDEIAKALVESLRRKWSAEKIRDRAKQFSYVKFKERLAHLLER